MQVKRKTDDYLAHHGVKGQRWGVRRYQNADGTLTDLGRKRLYGTINYSKKSDTLKNTTKFVKESGINKNETIKKAYDTYSKDTQLLTDARNCYHDNKQFKKENSNFDKLLKKAGIKYEADELDLSFPQIYCLNRGVNPATYATVAKNANKKYMSSMENEVNRILGDIGDQKVSSINQDFTASKYITMILKRENHSDDGDPYGSFEYDMLEPQYAGDTQLFEQIANTANKDKDFIVYDNKKKN